MSLHRLELSSVDQADDAVRLDEFADRGWGQARRSVRFLRLWITT